MSAGAAGAVKDDQLRLAWEVLPWRGKVKAELFRQAGELSARGDYTGAIERFKAALVLRPGAPEAMSNLGVMYRNGESVPKDSSRAVELFKQGCDSGNLQGCNLLGMLYEHGRGVPKDLNRATDLFHKACDGGFDPGCENLRRLKR